MDVALALKILAPLAGRAGAAIAPGLLRSWSVSFEATRKARKAGIQTKYFALRSFIAREGLFDLFEKPSEEELKALAPSLRYCIKNPGNDAEARLLTVLATAYVHSLPPSAATHLESEKTRHHVSGLMAHLEKKTLDTHSFPANCELLSPPRAESARELALYWASIQHAVAAIATSPDPQQLLQDWSAYKPDWMNDIPASGLAWLSSTAQDFGAATAAQRFLKEALAAGVSPRSYWRAKYVLAAPLSMSEAELELRSAQAHPLAAALLADLKDDRLKALEHMDSWQPNSPEELATKHLIVAQLTARDDVDQAVAISVEGYELYGSDDCALLAANLLLKKASRRDYSHFLQDLTKALELAEGARRSRRKWRGDTAEATLIMMTAYRLLGSLEQAWHTGAPAPEGAATIQESGDARIRLELARTAVDLGKLDQARDILQSVDQDSNRTHLEARLVDAESGFLAAQPLWNQALATATDPTEALNIGLRLALNGQEIEWPACLTSDHASEAADMDLISALHRGTAGSTPSARARATTSPLVANALIAFHISKEEYTAAAEVAEDVGRRWNDPETWLRAAEIRLKARELDRSVVAAEQAIRVGGQGWLREHEARNLLVQIRSNQGQWGQALVDAARLLEIRPEDTSAKWAYIFSQFMTGDYKGAWDSFAKLKRPLPETPDQVRIWLQVHSRFASNLDHLAEALDLATRWHDNESLRAAIVVATMRPGVSQPSAKQVQQLTALREQFFTDFPESKKLWAVTLETGNILESLTEILQPFADREDALEPVVRGQLPLGFATHVTGKSYAEVCLTRGAGKLFSGDPSALESELEDIEISLDQRVVLDVTALSTIALLGDQAREWLGYFSSGVIPTETVHDAQRAVAMLSSKSTTSMGLETSTNRPRIHEISGQEAQDLLDQANSLLDVARRLTAVPHPKIVQLPQIHSDQQEFHWLLALDMAKTEGFAFWCDDRILRSAARALGLRTFGTLALLKALEKDGSVDKALSQASSAKLMHNYYVGSVFDPDEMRLAGQLDSWLPKGAAAALTETGPTSTPQQQVAFGLKALRKNVRNPEAIQGWVISVSQWFSAISPDVATKNELNRFWFSTLLAEPWINSSALPFIVSGLRTAASDTNIDEIIPAAIADLYVQLADHTTHELAAAYVKELISNLEPEDRSSALQRIILNG